MRILFKDEAIWGDKNSLMILSFTTHGKQFHPTGCTDSSMVGKCFGIEHLDVWLFSWLKVQFPAETAVPPRPMDPKKDLAVYGYGTIAWKDRMEECKKKQNHRLRECEGDNGGDNDKELDGLGLPK